MQTSKSMLDKSTLSPMVLINFKTYLEATGHRALKLAKIVEKVSKETGVQMIVAVQEVDLRMIANAVDIPVFAQKIDNITPGSNTGQTLVQALKEAGASGVLINHSENRVKEQVEDLLNLSKKHDMVTVLCAEDDEEAVGFMKFDPDFVAVEPPELIGGDVSISTAAPELISAAVDKIENNKVLIGAGVKTGADVKIAKDLGAAGVLVASGVCKADDPEKVLLDFAKNLR